LPEYSLVLLKLVYFLEWHTILQCGIAAKKVNSDKLYFSVLQVSLVPSRVCWHLLLRRWVVLEAWKAGDGCELLSAKFLIMKLIFTVSSSRVLQLFWSPSQHTSSYSISQIQLPSSPSKNGHGWYIDSNIKDLKALVRWLPRLISFTGTL